MSKLKGLVFHLDADKKTDGIELKLKSVWGEYLAYNIYNLPEGIDYSEFYESLSESLGEVLECRPVNDESKEISKSRDIKPDPSLYHFYASNTRQPLHTDYAYYEESKAPEWLMLYCIQPSEFGGKTHILTVDSLKKIMTKYNPELLNRIEVEVNWRNVNLDEGGLHKKSLLNGDLINWNYWQIKPENNSNDIIDIAKEFHEFLENKIVSGEIYDFSKSWKKGDCIIFNDKRVLHGRSAFLGDRWIRSQAIY